MKRSEFLQNLRKTILRTAYYGYAMNGKICQEFYNNNK